MDSQAQSLVWYSCHDPPCEFHMLAKRSSSCMKPGRIRILARSRIPGQMLHCMLWCNSSALSSSMQDLCLYSHLLLCLQLDKLRSLKENGEANGITDLRWLEGEEAMEMEPALHCIAAVHSPSTGIVSSTRSVTCSSHHSWVPTFLGARHS